MRKDVWCNFGLNIRMGQHVKFSYDFYIEREINDIDYYDITDDDDIYFSRRNICITSNVFDIRYSINEKISLRFRTRHYYTGVDNFESYMLQDNGSLLKDPEFKTTPNNYISFNVDMSCRWIFAPGSELVFAWKNNVEDSEDYILRSIDDNYQKTFYYSNHVNTVSLKVLYYLDYNNVRKGKFF